MTAKKNTTVSSKTKIGGVVDGVSLGNVDPADDPEVSLTCFFFNEFSVQIVREEREISFLILKISFKVYEFVDQFLFCSHPFHYGFTTDKRCN